MASQPNFTGSLGVEPADLLRSLRKRWPLVLASIVVLTAAAGAGTAQMPPVFRARAQLLMEQAIPRVLDDGFSVDENVERFRRQREFLNTQLEIMTSRPVILDAISRIDLRADHSFFESRELSPNLDESTLVRVVRSMVSVEPARASQLVEIVVEDRDHDRAALLANAIGQAYIDFTLEQRLQSTREASRWLDRRIEEFAQKLEEREEQLQSFREQNLLVSLSLEDRQNMSSARLTLLNQRLIELKGDLIEKKSYKAAFGDVDAPSALALIGGGTEGDDVLASLRQKLVELKRRRAELATRYEVKHPEMLAVDQQIKETTTVLVQEEQRRTAALEKQIEAISNTIDQIEQTMEEEKRKALQLNSLGLEYTRLSRDVGNNRDIYQALLRRQSEADLSGLLEANYVRWFQQAEPSARPVSPSVVRNSLLGFGAGLALALAIIFIAAVLDSTIHDREDVENLGLPFLGVYPRVLTPNRPKNSKKDEKTEERDLYVFQNPSSQAAECARSIRTNLMFMGGEKSIKRILVSSPRPGEGKTTTTIAMGVTMAQTGNRVLLIDTDLRRPSLHRSFGIPKETGLTTALLGGNIEDAIRSSELAGLDILPCGPIPPNPSELLHLNRFHEILHELSERYDRILLDSPPLGLVVDGAILSKVVDGTMLVFLADDTSRDSARKAISRLEDVGARILGVVLNDYNSHASGYASSQYYGYSYEPRVGDERSPVA